MSKILVLSVNHQHTPLEIREKVAFTGQELGNHLQKLYAINSIVGCAILSTCNRSEIYITYENNSARSDLEKYLSETHQIEVTEILPFLDFFEDEAAVTHLCRVSSGLDSMVIGEPQILGQVKNAYFAAKEMATLDKVLEKLFQHAFHTAKAIRTKTRIAKEPVSIAYCAMKLVQKLVSDLSKKNILLIGSGEMIAACLTHLEKQKFGQIIVANRTLKKAEEIANGRPNIQAVSLQKLPLFLPRASVVIASTRSSIPIIGKGLVETSLKQHKVPKILFIDLSVPRNIESEVSTLKGVSLFSVDDLKEVIAENINNRKKEIVTAEAIIAKENKHYYQWLQTQPNEHVIKLYQQDAYVIRDQAIATALKKINDSGKTEAVIIELAEQLTNKLLHNPFQNIKKLPKSVLRHCNDCRPKVE